MTGQARDGQRDQPGSRPRSRWTAALAPALEAGAGAIRVSIAYLPLLSVYLASGASITWPTVW
jgi:hypothetical protein